MIISMSAPRVGTIWSVLTLPDVAVAILAGPFATPRGRSEYLVAPLYTGSEPGFRWTSEDVRLTDRETGLDGDRFAAIWNARPILEADLGLQLGELSQEACTAVKDVYWASLNERTLGRHPRLGKRIRSARDPAAQFQAAELERWQPFTGRVFEPPLDASASVVVPWMGGAWFASAELNAAIEESEPLVGPITIAGCGPAVAWLTGRLPIRVGSETKILAPPRDLFSSAQETASHVSRNFGVRVDVRPATSSVVTATDSRLAAAA